ncbi:TPA: hypothetical protein P2I01_002970 [Aeromonas salmonicida]|nr:hypothetical protein [Aeromonas salmonicida]
MGYTVSEWAAIGTVIISAIALLMQMKIKIKTEPNCKIEASYTLTSSEVQGNEIYIRNLNDRPIIIEHWVLEWHKGRWPFKKVDIIEMSQDFSAGRTIEAYSSMTLRFADEHYFSTRQLSEGKKLYIKLYVVGNKNPKTIKVY